MLKLNDPTPAAEWTVCSPTSCMLFACLLCCSSLGRGEEHSSFVTAPAKGQFVLQIQENASTGYVVALKRMSEGIYFLNTSSAVQKGEALLGAPSVQSFHFFNALETGRSGEVVFARFQPFDVPGTYSEERYVIRTGVGGSGPSPRLLGIYVMPFEGGLGVLFVQPGSMAHTMGIQPRDLVTHVNGLQVTSLSELHEAMSRTSSNQVSVRLRRSGKVIELRMSDNKTTIGID